ncbi:MAG: hypothetical protein IM531_10520 [Pseudanabaena sp. M090S1SP1A06QC]|nr:hypothetical protein [Pseudanabaena sp. M109S1SP1A06QC]MCA6605474.1 hypothetical protein [Pseudanabaena sp. M007S1SP1A06QC]MCA6615110.1 hypothetical protein [Pseudanabaena sp. M090S1SP1A06QC]MCE2976144.1 hypothetical protein [Pseudanabaena sp. CoA8_M7]
MHQPNLVEGNKPIVLGSDYSTLAWIPEMTGSWAMGYVSLILALALFAGFANVSHRNRLMVYIHDNYTVISTLQSFPKMKPS